MHEYLCAYCNATSGIAATPANKHKHWGWICQSCEVEMTKLEYETDWDTFEANKRERINEHNE